MDELKLKYILFQMSVKFTRGKVGKYLQKETHKSCYMCESVRNFLCGNFP